MDRYSYKTNDQNFRHLPLGPPFLLIPLNWSAGPSLLNINKAVVEVSLRLAVSRTKNDVSASLLGDGMASSRVRH